MVKATVKEKVGLKEFLPDEQYQGGPILGQYHGNNRDDLQNKNVKSPNKLRTTLSMPEQ